MSIPREWRNTPADRITVCPLRWKRYPSRVNGEYRANRGWSVWENGTRTSLFVVDTKWGKTVVDAHGRMVTCWHIGMSAGDLARATLRGAASERAREAMRA